MRVTKNICITGASSGIGAACARKFALQGGSLFLGARRLDKLESIKQECLELGASEVKIHPLDVRSDESCREFCETLIAHATPDILINNAGLVLGVDTLAQGSLEDWNTILDTNVMGVLRLCRPLLPLMIERARGHIVMIGSISGRQVYEGGSVYCASKHALKAITDTLRLELCGSKIKLTSIEPGMVETEFSLVRFKGDEEKAKMVYEGFEALQAEDIADCVEFACSRPDHVNIADMLILPREQASTTKVAKKLPQ